MKFILTAILIFLSTSTIADCVIKLRVYNAPPNYYQDESGIWKGVSVSMALAIIQQAGCETQFVEAPFKRALQFMHIGKIDMMSNLSKTQDRDKYINFFAKQRIEEVGVVVPKDSSFAIHTIDDLTSLPKLVGYLNGVFYGHEFNGKLKDKGFAKKFASFNSVPEMLDALKRKRISGLLYDKTNAQRKLLLDDYSQYAKLHDYTVFQNDIYFGLSRKSVTPEVEKKLKSAYQNLKNNGALNKMLESY